MEVRVCKASSDTTSEDHVVGPEESTFCVELVGDMMSHAGIHVGLTIFRCISLLPLPRASISFALGAGSRVWK